MARDGLSVVEWCLKRRRCLSCQGSFVGCCEGSRVATTALGGGLRYGIYEFRSTSLAVTAGPPLFRSAWPRL